MEIIVGVWLICGMGAAAIAGSKGRSGCGWMILGFFLGPIALLIVGFMAPARDENALAVVEHKQAQADANLRPCPVCAERIQRAALKCHYCGSEVEPMAAVVLPAPKPKSVSALMTIFVILVAVMMVKTCIAPH